MKKLLLILPIIIILSGCITDKEVSLTELTTKVDVSDANYKVRIDNLESNFVDDSLEAKILKYINIKLKYNLIAKPVVARGKVYILDNKANLVCLDAETYKELWKRSLYYSDNKAFFHSGGLLYNNDVIYVTYGDMSFVAVNANSGYEIFRKKTPSIINTTPVLHKDKIYLHSLNDSIYALGVNHGNIIWEQPYDRDNSVVTAGCRPIIYKDKWLIVFDSFGVISLNDLNSGNRILQLNPTKSLAGYIDLKNNITTQPILDKDDLYVANSNGYMVKLDLINNKIVWNVKIENIQKISSYGNVLFAITNSRQILAIAKDSGKVVWTNDLIVTDSDKKKSVVMSNPVIFENNLIVATEGALFKISPFTGKILEILKLANNQYPLDVAIENNKLILFTKNTFYIINSGKHR